LSIRRILKIVLKNKTAPKPFYFIVMLEARRDETTVGEVIRLGSPQEVYDLSIIDRLVNKLSGRRGR